MGYSPAMSNIFDAYDGEFSILIRDIQKSVNELKSVGNSNPERANSLIRHTEALISQATALMKQMNVELCSHDPSTRKILGEKVSMYSKSLQSEKSSFERAKEAAQRSNLIGEKSAADRQRLLAAHDRS